MKKLFLFWFSLLVMIFTITVNCTAASANITDEMVLRYILTDVTWDQDASQIIVEYIIIQKEKGKEPVNYPTSHTINGVNLKDNWNEETVKNFLEQEMFDSIYKKDTILSKHVNLFADISVKEINEEELNKLIEDAKNTSELNMSNPEKYIEESDDKVNTNNFFTQINTNLLTPLVFILLIAAVIFTVVFGGSGMLLYFFPHLLFALIGEYY